MNSAPVISDDSHRSLLKLEYFLLTQFVEDCYISLIIWTKLVGMCFCTYLDSRDTKHGN